MIRNESGRFSLQTEVRDSLIKQNIKAVRVDGKDIDIVNYARRSQGTEVGCCESKDSSDTCQTDACKSNKCENNATCVPSKYAGFTCDCKGNKAASWTGRYCQTKGTASSNEHLELSVSS